MTQSTNVVDKERHNLRFFYFLKTIIVLKKYIYARINSLHSLSQVFKNKQFGIPEKKEKKGREWEFNNNIIINFVYHLV